MSSRAMRVSSRNPSSPMLVPSSFNCMQETPLSIRRSVPEIPVPPQIDAIELESAGGEIVHVVCVFDLQWRHMRRMVHMRRPAQLDHPAEDFPVARITFVVGENLGQAVDAHRSVGVVGEDVLAVRGEERGHAVLPEIGNWWSNSPVSASVISPAIVSRKRPSRLKSQV